MKAFTSSFNMASYLNYLVFFSLLLIFSCSGHTPVLNTEVSLPVQLTLAQANQLARLPLECLQTGYPNKLGQTLGNPGDLDEPHVLHPVFYGCFDWHSSVHGYWSLVKLLKVALINN